MLEMIELPSLAERVDEDSLRFQSATPFPHIVLDELLRSNSLEELQSAFPNSDWSGWFQTPENARKWQPDKLACDDIRLIPEPLDRLIFELNSGPVLRWLEQLSGIPHLVPDAQLHGGGLHSTLPGGKLVPHIDFHIGENRRLYRRLNLLIYLNADWSSEHGGALELWDHSADRVIHEVPPVLGRTVLFRTDADSMHGFSSPVAVRPRNSIAIYYYTAEPPERYSGDTATHWRAASAGNDQKPSRLKRMISSPSLFIARGLGYTANRLIQLGHRFEDLGGRAPR